MTLGLDRQPLRYGKLPLLVKVAFENPSFIAIGHRRDLVNCIEWSTAELLAAGPSLQDSAWELATAPHKIDEVRVRSS